MDVENLAKELILKNMTPEQQMAVLDSVRSSVAQAKEVQKRKIGENVDLVVQALKKIESDIRDRFDSVGNSIEKRVLSIKDGRDGINGKDGCDGKDGLNGKDGLKGDKGDTGQDGQDGQDGVDGVSVVNANIDFDGSLVITLSDGRVINVGEVVSPEIAEKIKVINTMSTNAAIAVKDEGTTLTSGVKSLNFVGSGVTATTSGDEVTVTVSGGGSGTVTSVAVSGGTTGLTTSGSPITTSGTITLAGTLAVANGGTGGTTASTARANLLPTYASNAGKVLAVNAGATDVEYITVGGTGTVTSVAGTGTVNGISLTGTVTSAGSLTLGGALSGVDLTTQVTGTLPVANGGTGTATPSIVAGSNITVTGTWPNQTIAASGGGSGDVVGPASATDNALVRFDSTTGKLIQNSVVTVADTTGNMSGVGTLSMNGELTYGGVTLNNGVTGTGKMVLDTSPTLVTPALGTPTSGTLTNATGLPISSGVSGLGTDVATALAVNVGSAGAVVVNGGALGTPSSGTATNLTGLPLSTGVTGTLPIANGGTNATTAGVALTNLSAAGTAIANTFTDSQVIQAATATAEVVRVRGIDTNTSALAVQRYSADASPAEINLYKSRGATVGSDARVQTNDVTGSINYYACGSSAGSYQIIAAIRAQDGTTTADNDLPGSLRFFTRTDGAAGTLTSKMILGSGGTLSVTSDISTSGGSITAAGQISGSYYFATPPSQVVLNITQNALYAAPTSGFAAGDVIYTQDAYYATTQGGSPGYIPTYQSVYLSADFTLQAASGVQACLTAANDTLTIAAATTYEFEGQYILNTGSTTHTTAMAFLLASSATVSSFEYTTILWSAAANTISTSASFTQVSGVASKVLNATSTAVYTTIKFKGVMRTTLGGTITPQIAFSANPTGTNLMKKGSFIKFTPIGADTVEPIGLWS